MIIYILSSIIAVAIIIIGAIIIYRRLTKNSTQSTKEVKEDNEAVFQTLNNSEKEELKSKRTESE